MTTPSANKNNLKKGFPNVSLHFTPSSSVSPNVHAFLPDGSSPSTSLVVATPSNGGENVHRSATTTSLPPPYMADTPLPPIPSRTQETARSNLTPIIPNTSPSVPSLPLSPSATSTAVQEDRRDAKEIYSSFAPPKDWENSSEGSSGNRGTSSVAKPTSLRGPAVTEQLSVSGSSYASSPSKQEKDKDGLPACLSRQPPDDMVVTSFDPMFLTATKNRLREGFPNLPPPSQTRPHPFATHDVREADWTRFMSDLKNSATLGAGQITMGVVLPYVVYIPGATDYLSYKLRHRMYAGNEANVATIVDLWNHHFFRPRSLNAILMKGKEGLSGKMDDQVKDLGLSPPSTQDLVLRLKTKVSDEDICTKKNKSKGKNIDIGDAVIRLFIVPVNN